MKKLSDARFAFLHDPDLYDLLGRLALKKVGDEAFADDLRNGALVVAMELLLAGRGPRPTFERAWACRVLRNHAYAELRRRKKGESGAERVLEADEEPDLPVPDQQTLYEEQMRVEKRFDAVEQVSQSHREHVELLGAADGRTKQGADAAPKDAAARKRKERARTAVAAAVSALIAAAIVALVLRRPQPASPLPAGAFANAADARHELARQACVAHDWTACIELLEQVRKLDPVNYGADEQGARDAAVAGIRQQALLDCAAERTMARCLDELDTARHYDPEGDNDPTVTLARREAERKVNPGRGGGAQPLLPPSDAKSAPFRR